ncbi:MAG TPA: Gfo/Idh/MocA family oxidoreductase [Chloroflexota bacterium]
MGVIGVGVGAAEMLPAMDSMPEIQLVACADIVAETRQRFKERYADTNTYETAEALCADPNVEAVWVSSPNQYHAPHAILAAQHGKHVVAEKPMATSVQEAEQMIEAADKAGVLLLAGHTQSFTGPIRAMRKIIVSGQLGRLCAIHVWSYSDWMLRPRTAEELDVEKGGGLVNRQTPHQVDTVRLLGGGMLKSVRAATGQWFEPRPCPGYYSAFLQFEDGTPCTIMHNGYGYFVASELVPWGTTKVIYTAEERVAIRKEMREGTRQETRDKQELRIGGRREQNVFRSERKAWVPLDLGVVVVSCERGDIRHSANGLYVYDDEGMHEVELDTGRETFASERRGELEELYKSVVLGKPMFHDGRWGLATLEACLAIPRSAKEQRELTLSHQVPVPG